LYKGEIEMNGQNFGEHVITSDIVEETDPGTNGPLVVNSDPFTDNVPEDGVLIHAAPMSETVAAVDPMDETIVQEAPMGETILYKGSVGETITHETPISSNAGPSAALLDREESDQLRVRWNEIQGKFVDEPGG
jgi:hypothetical protein